MVEPAIRELPQNELTARGDVPNWSSAGFLRPTTVTTDEVNDAAFLHVQLPSREHERITTLDATIQTPALAIVLLIIGMACVVTGIAGLA